MGEDNNDQGGQISYSESSGLELLNSVYENIDISIFVIDVLPGPVFVYAGANPAHERLTGISQAMIAGKRPDEIHAPQLTARVIKNYQACVEAKEVIEYEERLVFNKIESWWMTRLIPLKTGTNDVYRIVGASRHITDLKDARLKAEQREKFVSTLLDTIPVPVYFKDKDGRYLGCNQSFADFTGYNADVIAGRTDNTIFPSAIAEMHIRVDEEVLKQGACRRYEYVAPDCSGTLRSVIYSKNVYYDGNGQPGIIGCFIDISEQKQVEDDLRSFSMHDELSGLFNRRAMLDLAAREIMRSKRDEIPVALIAVVLQDLEGFYSKYGQKAGDRIVATTGTVLDDIARRPGDLSGRAGGGLFLMVFPGTDASGVQEVAGRINKNLAQAWKSAGVPDQPELRIIVKLSPPEGSLEALLDEVLRVSEKASLEENDSRIITID